METLVSFGDVLEAADQLSLDEQETLIDILHRRLVEPRRVELAQDIQEVRQEFKVDQTKPASPGVGQRGD